ncbi:MAG: Do family serine endopeptidase [Desulfobacterales bacterium]|nr:Do family serine endopeptidase [Desulfobacterales bacterium]
MSRSNLFNYRRPITVALVVLGLVVSLPGKTLSVDFSRENAVVKAVKKVSPAVVNISSEYEVRQRSNPFFDFGLDPFFDSFFKDFFEPNYQRRYKRSSMGSGVIIDGDRGYILTNEHVLARSAKITVVLKDERELEAEIIGAAPDFDLAVLRIHSKKPLPAIQMGSSEGLMIGETVIAIGNPFGFSNTVTTGVISALNRSIKAENRIYRDFIQTDASINPGNSGGPLLNINGELIGINTAIYSKAQGIGFAIPINKAKRVIEDLIKYGEVHTPWLGLFVQDLDPKIAGYFKVPQGQGVLISDVTPRGPALEAGLRSGDVITAIDGAHVKSKKAYHAIIRDFATGDVIPVAVWRDRRTHKLQIRSRTFPEDLAEDLGYKSLGVRVQEISAVLRLRFKLVSRDGVIVTELRPDSYLDRIGARPGDVIRKINKVVVKTVDDFKRAVIKYRHKGSAVILIQRGNQQYYVTVKLEA